jgi:hypothetical protein
MEKIKILQQYIELLLTDDKALRSVLSFCKKAGIKEKDFYEKFNSLNNLDQHIWAQIFDKVADGISKEDGYINGNSREKILFFFYTLVEELKSYRSYIIFKRGNDPLPKAIRDLSELKMFKTKFEDWAKLIVEEGIETGEIADRIGLSSQYYRALWGHFLFLLEFWIKDNSQGFEKTDAAIEKSVNLEFELLARGPLESAIDFAKFLFQNQKTS